MTYALAAVLAGNALGILLALAIASRRERRLRRMSP